MKTEDFLNILEDRQLVSKNIVDKIRAKVSQGDSRVTSKSVLKYLVKKELITRRQAKDLLTTTLTVSNKAESSILGFVPMAEQPGEQAPAEPKPLIPNEPETKPKPVKAVEPTQPEPVVSEDPGPVDDLPSSSGLLRDPTLTAEETGYDPLLDDAQTAEASTGKGKSRKKKDRKRGKQNEWDSPLLLLGGGGLVVLLIGGGLIYWLLTRENADAILAEAQSSFESASYGQSIEAYEKFVETFNGHPEYSQAKVRLGMTRIWKATSNTKKFDNALEVAKTELDAIEEEESFAEDTVSKSELSSLLAQIAEGLSSQAESEEDPATAGQRIEQTEQALALSANTKYVPTTYRQDDRLSVVEETLDRVRKRQARDTDLASTLGEIDKAIQASEPAEAFTAYKQLVRKYPTLREEEQLANKVLEIAAAEQASVSFEKVSQPAITEERESPIRAEVALAQRTGKAKPGVEGVAVVAIDSGLFGLKASDGSLLWRRSIGRGVSSEPVQQDGAVYCWEATTGDFVCLEASSGKLRWRQPLADQLSTPVLSGKDLLVTGQSGKLYVLSAADGELVGTVQFSQPMPTPPAVNSGKQQIYLAGDHSNIYTLSNTDFSCVGVHYLGHADGSIRVSPLPVLNKLLVAENTGTETSTLSVFSLNQKSAPEAITAQKRLKGLVTTSLLADGRRVAAVTSLGQATVYEVGSGEGDDAIVQLANRDADRGPQLARQGLMLNKHLWLAGNELLKLAVLPTGNRLPVRSVDRDYIGDIFDGPLQNAGELVIHVRRPKDSAGAIVAAMDSGPGESLWETTLAMPLAGPAFADGKSLVAMDSSGTLFRADLPAIQRGAVTQSLAPSKRPSAPLTSTVSTQQNRLLAGALQKEQMVHSIAGSKPRTFSIPGPLASQPIAWNDGFIVPSTVGQVFYLDAKQGQEAATAFQPELRPGETINWLKPVAASAGNDSFVAISDAVEKLYLLKLEPQPQPHLQAVAAADVGATPLASPLAVLGNQVFAGTSAGRLLSFRLPDLEPGDGISLGGQIVWGPYTTEKGLLLVLDTEELVLVGEGDILWRQPLTGDLPTESPLISGDTLLLGRRDGRVVKLSLADGSEQATLESNRPLVSGPTAFGSQVAFATSDGVLILFDQP